MSLFNLIHILIGGLIIGNLLTFIGFCLPKIVIASERQLSNQNLCNFGYKTWQTLPVISWFYAAKQLFKPAAKLQPGLVLTKIDHQIIWRFPLMEISSVLLIYFAFNQFGFDLKGWLIMGLFLILLLITYIDLEYYLILDILSLPLIWAGLLINAFGIFTSAEQAIFGAAAGYLLLWSIFHAYRLTTGKLAMGYGDFKLLAALGAWFGLSAIPQILFISAVISALVGLSLVLLRRLNFNQQIAFGPYLAIGGVVTALYGGLLNF